MNYTISKNKRNKIVVSTLILILNYVLLGFSTQLENIKTFDIVEKTVIDILFIVAYGYVLFVIYDYFKHYKEDKLKLFALLILIGEITNQIFSLINSFAPIIPELLTGFLTFVTLVCMLIWVILLLRMKSEYSALKSLTKFAVGQIAAFGVGIILSIIILFGDFYVFHDIIYVLIAIPYIYIIEFAFKLKNINDKV